MFRHHGFIISWLMRHVYFVHYVLEASWWWPHGVETCSWMNYFIKLCLMASCLFLILYSRYIWTSQKMILACRIGTEPGSFTSVSLRLLCMNLFRTEPITGWAYTLHWILAINQLNAKNLFYNKFIIRLYMFRALCAHHQEVQIVLYSIWYHHTRRWPSRAQVESGLVGMHSSGGQNCIIQHLVSSHL